MRNLNLFVKKNAATILTSIGTVGVVATAVVTAKATPKATRLVDEVREEKGEELTTFETIKAAAPAYIPAVITGAATIVCIVGANVLNKKQQASLASAYALLDASYKQYKDKLKELYGEDVHNEVVDAIAAEKCKDVHITAPGLTQVCCLEVEENDGEPRLFYDEFSGRYFETTIEKLMASEYHLNRNLVLRGWSEVNEFYELLGLSPIDGGDQVGWSMFNDDGMNWVDFNHRKTVIDDEIECYIVEMVYYPRRRLFGLLRLIRRFARKTAPIMEANKV